MTPSLLYAWLSYGFAVAAHYSGLDTLYRRATGDGLVILAMHRLREDPDPYPLSISCQTLRQLLQWLHGGALVSLDEGLRTLSEPGQRKVHYALTFDDGYRDNLKLVEHQWQGVPAVIYLATAHIGGEPIWAYRLMSAVEHRSRDHLHLVDLGLGRFDLSHPFDRDRLYALLPARLKRLQFQQLEACLDEVVEQLQPIHAPDEHADMLDWEDVRKLNAHGIYIGGHTENHVLLSRIDEATARREIERSHARITAEVGATPRHFAYPNGTAGDFTERDIQLARQAGFQSAVTMIEGVNRSATDPFRLLRYNLHETRYRSPTGRLSKALFLSGTSGLLGRLKTSLRS